MTLEEIQKLWSNDCKIDRTEISEESEKTPKLHHKYFQILSIERLYQTKIQEQYNQEYAKVYETLTQGVNHDWKETDWIPAKGRLSKKDDITVYTNANPILMQLRLKLAMSKEKITYLESIIYQINQRSYHFRNIIDWEKFKVGQ